MDDREPWDVLWTGAYESTAFLTAMLVGLFSFIPDPTGYQDATDAAEILVYTYWRYAIVVVGLDVILKVVVLGVQWANRVRAYTIFWTLLLMMAPWAPLLNKLVAAIRAWGSVRDLMRSRVVRNEVSCVLREYLCMGHQSLTTAAATELVLGDGARFTMPVQVLQEVVHRAAHGDFHGNQNEYRERVQKLQKDVQDKGVVSWVVTRRAMRQEPLSRPRSRHASLLWWRRADVWTRAWTEDRLHSVADPFPPGALSRPGGPHGREAADGGWQLGDLVPTYRAYVLDVIDDCHRGYTLSQKQATSTLPAHLCRRCKLAVRGAVEAFLESSTRAHSGVHAQAWLHGTQMEWFGGMEKVADSLWEAAFADPVALRVDDGELEEDNPAADAVQRAPSPTVTTRKLLVFLFLIARSLLGACKALESVGLRIRERLHSRDWWSEYWTAVLGALRKDRKTNETYSDWLDRIRIVVVRDLTTAELKALIRLLADHSIRQRTGRNARGEEQAVSDAYCNVDGCTLNTQTGMVVKQKDKVRP